MKLSSMKTNKLKLTAVTLCAVTALYAAAVQKTDDMKNHEPIFEDVAVEDVLSFNGNPYGLVYNLSLIHI